MGRHHALKPHHLYLSPPQPSHPPSYYFSSAKFFHGTSTTALAVGDRIPGFKVSAAFLTNLHSNIFVDLDSCSNSAANTPDCLRPVTSLPPPSPLARAMAASMDKEMAPLAALSLPKPRSTPAEEDLTSPSVVEKDPDAIPELSTFPATDTDSRIEALKLVADSVAQQRNMGARTCIYHPATLAFLVAAFAVLWRWFYTGDIGDSMLMLMIFIGVVMSVFVGIRFACGGYIDEAEQVGTWKWMNKGRSPAEEEETGVRVLGDKDEVLLTKFGEYYIGAIIFRGVQPVTTSASPSKRTRKSQSANPIMTQIRGWTVAQKYRRKGVGASLIADALKIVHEKGWTAGGVEFAEDHANSKRLLPAMLNGAFEKMDRVAHKTLEKQLEEFDSSQDSKGRRKR